LATGVAYNPRVVSMNRQAGIERGRRRPEGDSCPTP
jgi:hypothetical protein